MALDVDKVDQGGNCVITLVGEVDLYSSPQVRKVVIKAIPKTKDAVGVDLSGVTYMDSSGVAVLVEGLKAAQKKGKRFALLAPSQSVMKVLELTRLDTVFEIGDAL